MTKDLLTYGTPLALAEYYKRKKGSLGPLRSWMDANGTVQYRYRCIRDSIV